MVRQLTIAALVVLACTQVADARKPSSSYTRSHSLAPQPMQFYNGSSFGSNPSMTSGTYLPSGNMGYGNYTTYYLNGGATTHHVTTMRSGNHTYVTDYSFNW